MQQTSDLVRGVVGSALTKESLAILAADGTFWLLLRSPPKKLRQLPVEQRQLLVSCLRAVLYSLLASRIAGPLLAHRNAQISKPMLSVTIIGIAINLMTALVQLPVSSWPTLFRLVASSHLTVHQDALFTTVLLPLGEELFFRRVCARLSSLCFPLFGSSRLYGILLTAALFTVSHGFGELSHSIRFFRNCACTGDSFLAPLICHVVNNFSAMVLDKHIAHLVPPPVPPLPVCNLCRASITVNDVRYNCTSCLSSSTDLCGKCYTQVGTHKREHVMEIVPVLDFSLRVRVSSLCTFSTASIVASALVTFASRPCLGELQAAPETGKLSISWRSFAQVSSDVFALASFLRSAAAKGSPVLLCGTNSSAWVISYLAVLCAGHVFVAAAPPQLAEVARRVRPVIILCDGPLMPSALSCAVSRMLSMLTPIPSDTLRIVVVLSPAPTVSSPSSLTLYSLPPLLATQPGAQDPPYTDRNAEALAAVVFTSGSSGIPKGVLWPDRVLQNAATESLPLYPLVAVDFTPPHHAFGMRQMLRVLCNGGQLAIIPSSLSLRLFECIRVARPTFLGAPAAFWIELQKEFTKRIEAVKNPQAERFSALINTRMVLGNRVRVAVCGGSAFPHSLLAFLRECLAPAIVSDGYAATECGTVATDGRIAPGTHVWLDCAPGSIIGEICVHSPSLSSGYLEEGAASTSSFVTHADTHYYRTGDLGERRPDGSIVIVGRKSASFKLPQGEFFNPERVETVLETSLHVQAAYVAWHAPTQRLVGCIVASERGRSEGWDEKTYIDEMRKLAQRSELQPFEVPSTVLLEKHYLPQLAQQALGRKKQRTLYAAYFDPIIAHHFSSFSAALPSVLPSITSATPSPFTRLPALAALLSDALGTHQLSLNQSFAAHGGDSLVAARFARRCQAELGCSFSVANALQMPSLYAIEAALYDDLNSRNFAKPAAVQQAVDWSAELQLPRDFYSATRHLEASIAPLLSHSASPIHVLLTGATGFLGPFLLSALLSAHTSVLIYCIVRADSHAAAEIRLRAATADLKIAISEAEWGRVRPLAGHVARPRFGLTLEEYAQLASSVAAVYHNAAQVHGILPYSILWPTNVGGALEAARLCLLGGGKHLHLISSINVLNPAADRPEALLSEVETLATLPIVSGYAQTKIVTETLCLRVLKHSDEAGLSLQSLSLHRPATISGNMLTGASNVHCFSTRVLCGLARLGCYPAEGSVFPPYFLLTPVDFVSEAIAAIGAAQRQRTTEPRVWHYVTSSPTSVAQLLEQMQLGGYELRAVGADEWRSKVEAMTERNMLAVFRDQLLTGALGKAHHGLGPQSMRTRTHLRAVAPAIKCEQLSVTVWRRYFAFLLERGLLPPAPIASPLGVSSAVADDTFFQLQEWYSHVSTFTPQSVWLTLSSADIALIGHLRRALVVPPRRARDQPYETTLIVAASGLERTTGQPSASFAVAQERKESRQQFLQRLKNVQVVWAESDARSAQALATLLAGLQLLMKRVADPVLGCFVRLGTRSPKDTTLFTDSSPSLPLSTEPLLRQYWGMSVATAEDALALLLTSARVQQDLHTASLESVPVTLIARRFVAQDPYWEFRMFVAKGRLTAASVYHTRVYSAAVATRQKEIATYLNEKVFPALSQHIPRTAYTMDVFLSPTLTTFTLVELNPPPPISDTALFSIQSPSDALRLLQGPFELRVVVDPTASPKKAR